MANTIRNINAVSGTVFDLPHAMSLPNDDCNVLLVSTRTLFFIQQFGLGEVGYLARYASQFIDGNRFVLADTSADIDNINDIVNNYQLEVVDMSCDLVEAISSLTSAVQALATTNCEGCGSEPDDGSATDPPVGPGTPWPDQAAYDVYKCEASNWLQDGIEKAIELMAQYGTSFWTGASVAGAVVAITAILLATTLTGLIVVVAGAVIAIALALIAGATIDLAAMLTILQTNRQELICQLYEGSSADDSRTRYLDWLTNNTAMTVAEVDLIELLMPNIVVNKLYEQYSPIVGYTITTSCGACAAPGGCDNTFVLFSDDTPRGSGDLSRSGLQRTLTSSPHPSNGFHYVSFKVGEPATQDTYFSNCAAMPAQCVGTTDEDFHLQFVSASPGTLTQSTATRCLDGSRSLVYNNAGYPPLGSYNISYAEFIYTAPFTVDVIIAD